MDKKGLLPIGEVSRLFHVSGSTLRHYENIGLLAPEYIAPDSGYRYYSMEQFEAPNTIRYLRALDMPLSEIADFLKNRDVGRIEEKLMQQKRAILKKRRELERIERKIDHRLQWLMDAQNTPLYTASLVRRPACRIVWMDDPLKIDGFLIWKRRSEGWISPTRRPLCFWARSGLASPGSICKGLKPRGMTAFS